MPQRRPWRKREDGSWHNPNNETHYRMKPRSDGRTQVSPGNLWYDSFDSARDWVETEIEQGRGFMTPADSQAMSEYEEESSQKLYDQEKYDWD